MVSVRISIIQHEQYCLIILVIGLKVATVLKKETLTQMFSSEFCEISRNNFFIEHIGATAFGLSFVNP